MRSYPLIALTIGAALLPLGLRYMIANASADDVFAMTGTQPQQPQPTNGTEHIERMDPALDKLIAPGTTPEKVAGGFTFVEGPMWRDGKLWFADEEGDVVHSVTADGTVVDLLDYRPDAQSMPYKKIGPNGMAPAPDGSVIEARQYIRDIVKLTMKDGKLTPTLLFDHFEGKHLNSPNDLVFAKDGAFYFTDPPYGLPKRDADPAKEMPFNGVYRVKNGQLTPVVKDLTLPNGIGLSPNGKTLYVANSGPAERVMKYPMMKDGTVGAGTPLIEFPNPVGRGIPDGLKVDARGNVWATGPGGIRIITPEGKVLGQIVLPETAANLAWGGADGKTVYITASHDVYRFKTLVGGFLPAFAK